MRRGILLFLSVWLIGFGFGTAQARPFDSPISPLEPPPFRATPSAAQLQRNAAHTQTKERSPKVALPMWWVDR